MSNLQSHDRSRPSNIRCLLGMLGTDVHNKGIRTLAQLLRDRGIDVIYLGEHNTCGGLTRAIIDEDADLIGLSFSSSNYVEYTRQMIETMTANDVTDVPVMIGGLIHQEDFESLKEMGVRGIFGPGSSIDDVIAFIHEATGKA